MNVEQKQESEIMERPTWDEYFSQFAFLAAARSHDSETKVGCVLVHENRIISVGYKYDNSNHSVASGEIFKTFFENDDVTNCPIQSCEILN